ncbi:Reverse transcriptase domain [Lasallia pustulata]|uniref:Reverse transcriptase domain n=1 Tax=Lasallia pustulata TaxID=136370 RepID=A0A1W5D1C4_9LECA|nr:Reverse transcriptase domain [Lasallia pustulata]
MLITPLGQHPIILGKPWLNRHGVVLDMKLDSLIFVPGRCSHFGAPKVLEPPNPKPLEKLPVSNSSKEDIPIPKVTKILKRPTNLDNTNRTEESRLREPPKVTKPRDFSIAMIGAAAFRTVTHQKGTQLFSITISELDKQLAGSKGDVHLNKISEMTEEERKDLRTKVPREFHDFLDVFDRRAAEVLPPNQTYDYKIKIDSDGPLPKSRLYPMSQFKLEKTKEYLEENLQKGFITPSNAPYASPILFAQKSNGDLRFCVDYRKLNALTKKDRYPLLLIDEMLAQMSGCKFITKFDIIAAFNKLRMDPGSEDLTTFITSMGLYKYCVLPFGLTNRPASYQHYMNNILIPYLNDFVQAYLDDIIIYSKTQKEHTQHVRPVLGKHREAGLQVDIKKSEFFVQETTFLSLVVSTEGLKMDPQKIEVIAQWPIPMKLGEVQSFIGFCNFYQRFIKEFSKIVQPLTRLAQKDTPFE